MARVVLDIVENNVGKEDAGYLFSQGFFPMVVKTSDRLV